MRVGLDRDSCWPYLLLCGDIVECRRWKRCPGVRTKTTSNEVPIVRQTQSAAASVPSRQALRSIIPTAHVQSSHLLIAVHVSSTSIKVAQSSQHNPNRRSASAITHKLHHLQQSTGQTRISAFKRFERQTQDPLHGVRLAFHTNQIIFSAENEPFPPGPSPNRCRSLHSTFLCPL